ALATERERAGRPAQLAAEQHRIPVIAQAEHGRVVARPRAGELLAAGRLALCRHGSPHSRPRPAPDQTAGRAHGPSPRAALPSDRPQYSPCGRAVVKLAYELEDPQRAA